MYRNTNASLGQGYATCTTDEATTAKKATLASYALTAGGYVAVKFTYAVPAGSTLSVNSKTAKPIYYKGAAITSGIIDDGDLAVFLYNGSQYHLVAIDRNVESQPKITASGLLKGDGSGGVTAAVAGTDYIASHQDIGGKLDKSGGTMTGALTLSGAPSSDLHAATKKYVDDYLGDIETLLASI